MPYQRKRPGGKIRLTHRGRSLSVGEWARELGWNADVIYARVRKGWAAEAVLTTAVRHGGARRRQRLLTHEGRTQDVAGWARELGLAVGTLRKRLAVWPVGEALGRPPFRSRRYVFQNRAQSLREWAEEVGMPLGRLAGRLRRGWSLERALTAGRMRGKKEEGRRALAVSRSRAPGSGRARGRSPPPGSGRLFPGGR
jgi:hypothetical protein